MAKRIKENFEVLTPETIPELLLPHVELCSDKKAVVSGCKGIMCYSGECVKLNCKNKIITFLGNNLCLTALLEEEITVGGTIIEVRLE